MGDVERRVDVVCHSSFPQVKEQTYLQRPCVKHVTALVPSENTRVTLNTSIRALWFGYFLIIERETKWLCPMLLFHPFAVASNR